MNKLKDLKINKSFKLEPRLARMLENYAVNNRKTQTALVEDALDDLFKRLGISPEVSQSVGGALDASKNPMGAEAEAVRKRRSI